ncbi:MAG: hypothetical protein PSV16_07450 [Flavobacterium sp.]|nr:hypothetical protein [Flavobacterium sp.]
MKKSILFFVFVLITFQVAAQKIKIGANAGATYSKFRGYENIENYDAGFGFLVGVDLEYKIKENL